MSITGISNGIDDAKFVGFVVDDHITINNDTLYVSLNSSIIAYLVEYPGDVNDAVTFSGLSSDINDAVLSLDLS